MVRRLHGLDELHGPRDRFVLFGPVCRGPLRRRQCRPRSRYRRGRLTQQECSAKIRQFNRGPCVGLPLSRTVPHREQSGFPTPQSSGHERMRASLASARSAESWSSANWRMVSNIENRVRARRIGQRPTVTCGPGNRGDPRPRTHRTGPPTALSALQVEPPCEHRTPCQQGLFGIIEQVIGPLDGMAQRLVASRVRAATRRAAGTGR